MLNHDIGVKTRQTEKSYLNSYTETGGVGGTPTTMLVLLLFGLSGVLGAGSLSCCFVTVKQYLCQVCILLFSDYLVVNSFGIL